MKARLVVTMASLAVSLAATGTAAAQTTFQAPYGPGGTWRVYEIVAAGTSFKDALAQARLRLDPVFNSVAGDLASVTSDGKNRFLHRTVAQAGDLWIGLTDREGAAPGAQESQTFGGGNRTNGWAWTNGDPFAFNIWGGGEPNDSGGEDAGHIRGDGLWNDNKSGFFADDPVAPSIQPGTSGDESAVVSYRYVIEWNLNTLHPVPGIRYGMVFPPCTKLPVARNNAGKWSLREVRNLTMNGNIIDAVDKALSGTGEIYESQVDYLDFTDPDTNAPGGPIITATPPFPYLADQVGVDDNNILVMAATRISIPAAGPYTFQVRGDDGFALRIRGSAWSQVNGDGYIDPLDPQTLVFERGTGDANTRGVIELPAGQHDVEFVTWEGGGGAYFEVTSATGVRLTTGEAQWLPLGSTAMRPEVNTINAVRLSAPATVQNANLRDRDRALPSMRYLIDNATRNRFSGTYTNLVIAEGAMVNNNGGDNYITKVVGRITVAADANANTVPGELIDVTFRLNCDDGASLRIIGQDFLDANTGGGRELIDNGGDITMTADFPTGDTDLRGRIQLTEGQSYDIVSYMYEYGGGSRYELYWQLGDHVAANLSAPNALSDIGEVRLAPSATVYNTPISFDNVPTLPVVKTLIDPVAPVIGVNAAIKPVLELQEVDMPANNGGDNYLTKVTGKITVAADANANTVPGETIDVTFRLNCDDGAQLRIVGQDFLRHNEGPSTLVDVSGDMSLTGDYPTGDTNAHGLIRLMEGQTYDFEAYMYEFGGGSNFRLYWELGDLVAGMTAPVALATGPATTPVRISSIPDPVGNPGVEGALVLNAPSGGIGQTRLPFARSVLAAAAAQNQMAASGTTSIVVLRDGDDICCGRPGNGIYGSAVVMPNGGGPDNYATRVTGQLVIDDQDGTPNEDITVTFGLFSDDGMDLRIVGRSFATAADTTGDGNAILFPINGDLVLAADYWTGNSQAFGVITLREGVTYSFESHHFEGGGDSGMEIWWAVGAFTAFDPVAFRPLNTDAGFFLPGNTGIALVETPNPDVDNDGMPDAWETANSVTSPTEDADGDGANNLAEYAAGTNPNDNASAFRITQIARTPTQVSLTFPGVPGRSYRVVASAALNGGWTNVGDILPPASAGSITYQVTNPALVTAAAEGRMYFAVIATPCP